MISLTDWIKNRSIENVDLETLKNILQNTCTYADIEEMAIGVLVIKSTKDYLNEKIISCVANYYMLKDEEKKLKTSKIAYSKCLMVQNMLNIKQESKKPSCKECHLKCIYLEKAGHLSIVKKGRK